MKPKYGVLYLANLDPGIGTEPGKFRPVLVVQNDIVNEAGHPSTWILPCTTTLRKGNLLRVSLPAQIAGNDRECDIMIDQSRAIDNRRLKRELKPLPPLILREVKEKLRLLGNL